MLSTKIVKEIGRICTPITDVSFGTAAGSNLDFASLASKDAAAFTKKADFKGFDGAGAKLFEVSFK